MTSRGRRRRYDVHAVLLGTCTWGILLVILLAAISVPELGGWPKWLWLTGR
jgi:hypothetical protein